MKFKAKEVCLVENHKENYHKNEYHNLLVSIPNYHNIFF